MRRSVATYKDIGEQNLEELLAEIAYVHAGFGLDKHPPYKVGCALSVKNTAQDLDIVYAGFNVNYSGMEVKVHAEQLALFQAILDMEYKYEGIDQVLNKVVVVTGENDLALKCGHCIQVVAGGCDMYDWNAKDVDYMAAAKDGDLFEFDRYTLHELLPESYIEKSP